MTESRLACPYRGLEPYDEPALKKITDQLAGSEYKSTVLVAEIVKSYPFRYRRDP